jgi:flagellar motility protein MotE (MotC chaperone)
MNGRQAKTARPSRARAGRGVLSIIAGMLIASGLIRVGNEAEQAFATEQDVANTEPADPAACDPAMDNTALLDAYRTREERIAAREAQVEDRLQAMRVAEAEITERLAQLQAAQTSLADTISVADTAAEQDLGQLTAVYENMKPQDAAALFETMEPDFSAGFVGRMRPEIAAAIMAQLQPETAYAISAILAGRNANVPTE